MKLMGRPARLCIMADCPVCGERNIVVIGGQMENGRLISMMDFENTDSKKCAHLRSAHTGYSKLTMREVYALEFIGEEEGEETDGR